MMALGAGNFFAIVAKAAPAAPGRNAKVGAPWGTNKVGMALLILRQLYVVDEIAL
jgi:hypothetical protein